MGYSDLGRMCEILNVTETRLVEKLHSFVGDLYSSQEYLIQTILRLGLPGFCAAELPMPNTVRCRKCGNTVSVVPCVSCANSVETKKKEKLKETADAVISQIPTLAPPGSDEKIEIMRLRILRGESPFHPQDAILPVSLTQCQ